MALTVQHCNLIHICGLFGSVHGSHYDNKYFSIVPFNFPWTVTSYWHCLLWLIMCLTSTQTVIHLNGMEASNVVNFLSLVYVVRCQRRTSVLMSSSEIIRPVQLIICSHKSAVGQATYWNKSMTSLLCAAVMWAVMQLATHTDNLWLIIVMVGACYSGNTSYQHYVMCNTKCCYVYYLS